MRRAPGPPFSLESALLKVRTAENAWNGRDPHKVASAYTPDYRWRNRAEQFAGTDAIVAFLTRKWAGEHEYRLIKQLWAFGGDRISARFAYEYHDADGRWWRAHGNEQWVFDGHGLMTRRDASINDVAIAEADRLFRWPQGPRPDDHPGLDELGL